MCARLVVAENKACGQCQAALLLSYTWTTPPPSRHPCLALSPRRSLCGWFYLAPQFCSFFLLPLSLSHSPLSLPLEPLLGVSQCVQGRRVAHVCLHVSMSMCMAIWMYPDFVLLLSPVSSTLIAFIMIAGRGHPGLARFAQRPAPRGCEQDTRSS